jgi:hypothetical protein
MRQTLSNQINKKEELSQKTAEKGRKNSKKNPRSLKRDYQSEGVEEGGQTKNRKFLIRSYLFRNLLENGKAENNLTKGKMYY